MNIPDGCGDMSREVVLLQRVAYGRRRAGRQWSLRLSKGFMQKAGMEQSKADPCFSARWLTRKLVTVCVHFNV